MYKMVLCCAGYDQNHRCSVHSRTFVGAAVMYFILIALEQIIPHYSDVMNTCRKALYNGPNIIFTKTDYL